MSSLLPPSSFSLAMLNHGLFWVVAIPSAGFVSFYLWLKAKRGKSPLPGLPCPPDPHWLIGHVENRNLDIEQSLSELCADHANEDGVTAMWYFGTSTATVLRYQDARAVLQSTPARMNMPVIIRKHLEMLTGRRNILLLEDREWKYHRSAIVRALGPYTMEMGRHISVQVGQQLAESLRKVCNAAAPTSNSRSCRSVEVKLLSLTQMVVLDVFGRTALNFDFQNCKQLKLHPLASAFHFMSQEYERRMQSPLTGFFYSFPTEKNREYSKCRKQLRDFIEGCVQERMAHPTDEQDFLHHLLNAKEQLIQKGDGPVEAVVEETLTDILMTLLFAGHETTALSLTYAILEVARNAEVESKILDEVLAVRKNESDVPDSNQLKYCSAVITEALRLYPPLPGMPRTLTKPVEVGTGKNMYTLPVGTYTYMPFILIHRDERNFPRPMEFLPERWVTQDENGTWHDRAAPDTGATSLAAAKDVPAGNKNAFFAFSVGGRSCPGQKFAMQEGVLVLATLIRTIQFRWKEGYSLHVKHASAGQRPSDAVPIMCSVRR